MLDRIWIVCFLQLVQRSEFWVNDLALKNMWDFPVHNLNALKPKQNAGECNDVFFFFEQTFHDCKCNSILRISSVHLPRTSNTCLYTGGKFNSICHFQILHINASVMIIIHIVHVLVQNFAVSGPAFQEKAS